VVPVPPSLAAEVLGALQAALADDGRQPWVVEFYGAGLDRRDEKILGMPLDLDDQRISTRWVRVDARPCDPPAGSVIALNHEALVELRSELRSQEHPPDAVIAIDGFQHDPVWGLTVQAAVALVRLGGVLAFVWEDQSLRAEPDGCSPEVPGFAAGAYRQGVSTAQVLGVVCAAAARSGRDVDGVLTFYGMQETERHRAGLLVSIVPQPAPTPLPAAPREPEATP
jgi:hypothetical protein